MWPHTACGHLTLREASDHALIAASGSDQWRVTGRAHDAAMTTPTLLQLPVPSRSHATCAWCHAELPSIVALLEHVDRWHVDTDSPRCAHADGVAA